jgi:hypothetical protein
MALALAISKIALLTKALIVPTLVILPSSSKEVELDTIDLFRTVLKEDLIKLDKEDFKGNVKEYKRATDNYKQGLLNKDITKYIILIILFSLLLLILGLLVLIISWIILLIYISLRTYRSKSIGSFIRTL